MRSPTTSSSLFISSFTCGYENGGSRRRRRWYRTPIPRAWQKKGRIEEKKGEKQPFSFSFSFSRHVVRRAIRAQGDSFSRRVPFLFVCLLMLVADAALLGGLSVSLLLDGC